MRVLDDTKYAADHAQQEGLVVTEPKTTRGVTLLISTNNPSSTSTA